MDHAARTTLRLALVITLASLALPLAALAESTVFPPAMLSACKGKGAGEACGFVMSGKTIQGACAALPDAGLACRPGGKPKAKAKPAPK